LQNCKKQLLASLCLSVHMQQLGSHWVDFYEIGYLSMFLKTVKKIHVSFKIRQEKQLLYMKTTKHFLSYLTQFFLEWEMFHTKVVEQINTHTLCSIIFFLNRAIYDIMWKNAVEQSRPYDYTVRVHCMLGN